MSICAICQRDLTEMNEMEGCGVIKEIEKVTKKIRKTGKKAGKYVTSTDGLLSDAVLYGTPAVTSAALGALGTAASGGNPAIGILASALGSKLGTIAADKIADETLIRSRYDDPSVESSGGSIKPKRKAKFEKGSQEAKNHMAELRAKRVKKTSV